jgi:deoxyribodipyrimidine photolyase-like uncharacterized protein
MRFLIDKLGIVPAILMTKTAYFALLIGTFPDLPEWFLAAVAAAYVLVVSNNAHQMAVAKQ